MIRFEPERASVALVNDTPVTVDYVEPVRPRCIIALRSIFYRVNQGRKLDPQVCRAGTGQADPLIVMLRIFIDYILFFVYRQLPGIAWMRFLNVDQIEGGLILIPIIDFVQVGNLPTERRSGVATEDQHDRLFTSEIRKLHS